jgi:hypothetical protein
MRHTLINERPNTWGSSDCRLEKQKREKIIILAFANLAFDGTCIQ